jgi:hypothetical protein
MADMLKPPRLLFGFSSPGSGWSTWQADAAAPVAGARAKDTATDKGVAVPLGNFPTIAHGVAPGARLPRALARSGRRLLLRHFLAELSKVLDEQEQVIALLDTSRAWSLPLLNRQFYAVRVAARELELENLAQVAGRAEVLVNLIDSGELTYEHNHGAVIRETHRLLRKLVFKVIETNSDDACYAITQTVWSMHAALNPALCEYEPGEHAEHSVAQSTSEPGQS